MKSAIEHLKIEQINAFKNPHWGFDLENKTVESQETIEVVNAIAAESPIQEVMEEIPDKGLNPHLAIRHMAKTIEYDINKLLFNNYPKILENVIFGFLPTGLVNGCVFNIDSRGQYLDKYIVALNYGLFFSCASLSDALIFEILEGDLLKYKKNGAPYFYNSIQYYLSPTSTNRNNMLKENGLPSNVLAQIRIKSGALASIMLQFVALHEIGHIVNGDTENKNGIAFYSLNNSNSNNLQYKRLKSESLENWPCEYAADEFAIKNLSNWGKSDNACWANTAQIYLFFKWLEKVEEIKGGLLCEFHPHAKDRALKIKEHAYRFAKNPPIDDYFSYIDHLVDKWFNKNSI